MYIKIFFDSKPLFLCDDVKENIEPYIHREDTVFIDELNAHSIKTIINEIQQEKVHAGVFFHEDLEKLKNDFFKKFKLIKAGGGLVTNNEDEILLIFRNGFWDLPKGKLEPSEEIVTCALREVQEETGLKSIFIEKPLTITYHTYHLGTKFVLKASHWYKMKADKNAILTPQTEEGITTIKWVHPDDISSYFATSYPSIVEVIHYYLNELKS